MRAITELNLRVAGAAIIFGVVIGTIGFVRTGSLFLAAGTAVIALSRFGQVNPRRRIVECYFPLAIALVLFALAVALPKGL
jgi:hypothetical protein